MRGLAGFGNVFGSLVVIALHGCASGDDAADAGRSAGAEGAGPARAGDTWSVTAWGESFEIFAGVGYLVAGESAHAQTHVTVLSGFTPLERGAVALVLRAGDREEIFRQDFAMREGIFDIALRPSTEGEHELLFRIASEGLDEEIPAGIVRVGSAGDPGALLGGGGDLFGEGGVAFTKEMQWRTAFGTRRALEGELPLVARGPGRVRPVAGGEIVLAAPMRARLAPDPWPHVGRTVAANDQVFALTPDVASDRSLAELGAIEIENRVAMRLAEERLERLEGLLAVDATSRAEVDAARARLTSLRAQHEAARRDLRTARSGRGGGSASGGRAQGETISVVAPFGGQIADVRVQPGEVVSAGQALARVVRTAPYWVEVLLRPAAARAMGPDAALALRGAGTEVVTIDASLVRLVSRAPEVDASTGTVTCVFEVDGAALGPILGSAVEVEVALRERRAGVVVPAASIVDDGGVPVVYQQIDGETFVRREVGIEARQGRSLLVRGIEPGARVVSLGGAAIRRATLISTGVGQGHAH